MSDQTKTVRLCGSGEQVEVPQQTDQYRGMVVSDMQQIRASLLRIEGAVLGDTDAGQDGLVKRMHMLEHRVDNHDKLIWIATGAGAVVGFLWRAVVDFFTHH